MALEEPIAAIESSFGVSRGAADTLAPAVLLAARGPVGDRVTARLSAAGRGGEDGRGREGEANAAGHAAEARTAGAPCHRSR